jgi:hypothetical protein
LKNLQNNQQVSKQITSPKLVTLGILATLWTLGGLRLLWSGSFMLISSAAKVSGTVIILSLLGAFILGFGKGKFVLQKTAQRTIDSIHQLSDEVINYFIGWIKVLGVRGFVVIGLMIGLGILFASNLSPLTPFLRGLVRITIGSALIIGSLRFWSEFRSFLNKK